MFFTLTVSGKDMFIEKLITNLFPVTEQEKEKAHKNVASSKRYLISKTIYNHSYQLVL